MPPLDKHVLPCPRQQHVARHSQGSFQPSYRSAGVFIPSWISFAMKYYKEQDRYQNETDLKNHLGLVERVELSLV